MALVCGLYAGFVLTWELLRYTPVGHWWPFELLDIFGLLTFAPLPLLLLIGVLCASRRAALLLVLPISVLAWEYGALFLPRPTPTVGQSLRVLSTNLLVSNRDLAQVSAMIVAEQPDIVAIQELGPAMAEHLARELGSRYPHQILAPSDVPNGLGILSRYPFTVEPGAGGDDPICACQRVILEVEGHSIAFVNVHPLPPTVSYRRLGPLPVPTSFDDDRPRRSIERVLERVTGREGPVIVAGDFNVGDRQPLYRRMRNALQDAHREAGWGFGYSFPAVGVYGLPAMSIIRIDYILHNEMLTARASRVGSMPGSDHRYVVADLLLHSLPW